MLRQIVNTVIFPPKVQQDSSEMRRQSEVKELLQLLHGVFWALDGMADGSGIVIDFPVISTLECFVPEKVDVLVVNTGESLGRVSFGLDVLQAVGLVPSGGEDIKGNLAADGITGSLISTSNKFGPESTLRKPQVGEFFLNGLDHFGSAAILLVPSLELVSFRLAGITANRTDVDHTVSELNESPAHGRESLEPRDVPQAELCQFLVSLFPDPLNEGVGR